ncbi:hypothetical protein PENDEC_c003G04550 [Penicillium decumbens]|uniref:DNA-(apurinic or apyrimidinic site) endonuclease 2 n=1 Tax=Penicillium decumbens TaxID=69771 RepID=A0A1V6PJC2_PENDC|nr:hypothetical protein PENDEC_c003G04550 [Penicillium decumbens]
MGFRITTWNVNGIRYVQSMFEILEADIVVFQETKIQRKDLRDDMVLVPGWDCYFSLPKFKKGELSFCIADRVKLTPEGITGILCPPNSAVPFRDLPEEQQIGGYPTSEQLTRPAFMNQENDEDGSDDGKTTPDPKIDAATLDSEGRSIVLEFPAFVLIGVYCPAYRDESRDFFRMDFLTALDARVRNLIALGKRVFMTGDINIAKTSLDSAHALEGIRKRTTTEEEYISTPPRRLFNSLLSDGVVVGTRDEGREQPVMHDICRSFHPERSGMYTCWDTRLNTRPGNFGARIDYVLCSLDMQDWFCDSNIQEGLMGSDHCPVFAVFKDQVPYQGGLTHIRDIMNPPGMFKDGKRQQEYSSRFMLPASGRLLPEFDMDKRRSIKDMFARKPPSTLSRSSSAASALEKPIASPASGPATPTTTTPNETLNTLVSCDTQAPGAVPLKRSKPPPAVSAKRSKSITAPSASGQKSLMGFFKPKAGDGASPKKSNPAPSPSMAPAASQPPDTTADIPITSTGTSSAQPSPGRLRTDDSVVDPIVSKEDWTKLFTKKAVPRCESHQEPCISLTTKKPGMNRGRAFWICPRPLGPRGEKEKGSQWRCPTFIWASDWNSTSQSET